MIDRPTWCTQPRISCRVCKYKEQVGRVGKWSSKVVTKPSIKLEPTGWRDLESLANVSVLKPLAIVYVRTFNLYQHP